MSSPIDRILEWRKKNPNYNELRLAGLRKSEKVKAAARMVNKVYRAKAVESMMKNPRCQPKPSHASSKVWHIRNSTGTTFKFKNLAYFIRENPFLFNPEDIVWKKMKNRKGNQRLCLAYQGISSLYGKTKTAGTWKGWTRVSERIERMNGENDLLERKYENDITGTK